MTFLHKLVEEAETINSIPEKLEITIDGDGMVHCQCGLSVRVVSYRKHLQSLNHRAWASGVIEKFPSNFTRAGRKTRYPVKTK